jgi:hypothetical protein
MTNVAELYDEYMRAARKWTAAERAGDYETANALLGTVRQLHRAWTDAKAVEPASGRIEFLAESPGRDDQGEPVLDARGDLAMGALIRLEGGLFIWAEYGSPLAKALADAMGAEGPEIGGYLTVNRQTLQAAYVPPVVEVKAA